MQVTTSLGSFEFSHDPAATRVNGRPVVRKTTLFLDFAREEGHVKLSDGFGSRVCETREAPALAAHLRRCWDLQTNDRIPARDTCVDGSTLNVYEGPEGIWIERLGGEDVDSASCVWVFPRKYGRDAARILATRLNRCAQ